ncbi:MAG: hypothetical protein ACYTF9_05380 [Planctomycetota bacterium]|jgi:hypothetical protein
MPPNQTCTLELKPSHLEYLEAMVEKHGLPDTSKALRCLVTYARSNPDMEDTLFREIRCTDCS